MYDVVIIGGGPVGVALAIELGLQNIKILILEKYDQPLHTARAQTLSARTMEFFLRWGIDKEIEEKILLPKDLPQAGVWCSTLNGITYFVGKCGDNDFNNNESPKEAVRIPLWITENVLRKRLDDFPSVTFLKNHEVQDIQIMDKYINIKSFDKINQKSTNYNGSFVACCDGALGPSKKILNNNFRSLSQKTRILSVNFTSFDILDKKTVEDGIFYSILTRKISGFLSPIDLNKGSWIAQIIWKEEYSPNQTILSNKLDDMIGEIFYKDIIEYHFWDMEVQLAEFFSLKNKIFWLGDSAHAFAPTGGLGLNTGFGDAENLAWKLAYVIKNQLPEVFLSTYEKERYSVWMNNLDFAKKNAEDFLKIKQQYPIEQDFEAFVRANASLGRQFLNSSKLTMGYCYPPEQEVLNNTQPSKQESHKYIPLTEPGYFLPHTIDEYGKSIYEKLLPVNWNLIVSESFIIEDIAMQQINEKFEGLINVIEIKENSYPYIFILIRPDWHIIKVTNYLEEILSFKHKTIY